jgi:hypothetical protein
MLELSKIIVTQHNLREPQALNAMVEHAKTKPFDMESIRAFDPDRSSLIQISKVSSPWFPPATFLHDGHHRCASMWIAGVRELDDSEYEIREYTLGEYRDIVFKDSYAESWLTPMNPFIHVRDPEFFNFKKLAHDVYVKSGTRAGIDYINRNSHMYRQSRKFFSIEELSDQYKLSVSN